MQKKTWILYFLIIVVLLSACSEEKKPTEKKEETTTNEENANVDMKELIGETIVIMEDGSIQLPFDKQVFEASFSEDGYIKAFVAKEFIAVIEGEEIIYAEEINSTFVDSESILPTVSDDGRFVTWKAMFEEEDDISVYDVENDTINYVKETDELDPHYIFPPQLIEKHGEDYYLIQNDYKYALGQTTVLNLTTLELTDDSKVKEKFLPKKPIAVDEIYDELIGAVNAKSDELGSDVILRTSNVSDYGYYEIYDSVEEDKTDDKHYVTHIYGSDVEKGILKAIDLGDIVLGKENMKLVSKDIKVADNGFVLLPMIKGDLEDDSYEFYVYYVDLEEEKPKAILVEERENSGEKQSVFFNEDASALFISEEGKMEKYELK